MEARSPDSKRKPVRRLLSEVSKKKKISFIELKWVIRDAVLYMQPFPINIILSDAYEMGELQEYSTSIIAIHSHGKAITGH